MGMMDKLRGELIDIVEWVDDRNHTLVWRYPRYHNQIKNGAQLIVRPGQTAILVNQGRVADLFGPGPSGVAPTRVIVVDVFKEYPVGNSRTWVPRALDAVQFEVRPLLARPQARVVEVLIRGRRSGVRNRRTEPGQLPSATRPPAT